VNIEHAIIEARKRLDSNPYSQKGAISILYELNQLGIDAPSVATINRILKRNGLIKKTETAISKSKEYPTHYYDVQQMDLIGPRYLKGRFLNFTFLPFIDKNNHMSGYILLPIKQQKI